MPLGLFGVAETLCDDPSTKQKVGNGVRGDGITNSVCADHQKLVDHPANNAGQPVLVSDAEYDGCDQKWFYGERVVLNEHPVRSKNVSVQE